MEIFIRISAFNFSSSASGASPPPPPGGGETLLETLSGERCNFAGQIILPRERQPIGARAQTELTRK